MKKILAFTIMLVAMVLAIGGNAFAQTPDIDKLREALEQRLKEIEHAKKYTQKGYTLDLRKVPFGELPKEWDGPDNALVNNIGGSKCLTTNAARTPATLTITDHFNQPGDFVLNFTPVGKLFGGEVSTYSGSVSGQIMDENGHTISFGFGAIRLQFGDLPGRSFQFANSQVCTITRRGNVLSMTSPGLKGEAITMRSDTFKSLTGFSITIPSHFVGISALSVRSLDAPISGDGPRRSAVPGSVVLP